jgi:probable phosphoglycerate mutase
MGPDVILVRHGQTEWSALGKHTGITDVPLTELGRRQGVALADMLAGMEFGAVLSSPRLRALQTMEIAGFGHLGVIVDDLQEWDYGAYEGRTTGEIRREVPDWSVWSHPIIEGESVDEVGDRADRVIERALSASGPVALFGHGHLLRILAARWIGLPADHGRSLVLQTATVSLLGWEGESRVITRWNQECPLPSNDPLV